MKIKQIFLNFLVVIISNGSAGLSYASSNSRSQEVEIYASSPFGKYNSPLDRVVGMGFVYRGYGEESLGGNERSSNGSRVREIMSPPLVTAYASMEHYSDGPIFSGNFSTVRSLNKLSYGIGGFLGNAYFVDLGAGILHGNYSINQLDGRGSAYAGSWDATDGYIRAGVRYIDSEKIKSDVFLGYGTYSTISEIDQKREHNADIGGRVFVDISDLGRAASNAIPALSSQVPDKTYLLVSGGASATRGAFSSGTKRLFRYSVGLYFEDRPVFIPGLLNLRGGSMMSFWRANYYAGGGDDLYPDFSARGTTRVNLVSSIRVSDDVSFETTVSRYKMSVSGYGEYMSNELKLRFLKAF
ncbi:MAG: hypothetical protein PHE50_10260 [Dehalococcoidales bacterium]|nr:hypothetical protein [Dehalococcoidales bacterium]